MDWFKGKFAGKSHISWENLRFPVDFPLNQSIEITTNKQQQHIFVSTRHGDLKIASKPWDFS